MLIVGKGSLKPRWEKKPVKKIRNVWIEDPFAEAQAEHLRKSAEDGSFRLQVPHKYGEVVDLLDKNDNVVKVNGEVVKKSPTRDGNTYRVIVDVVHRYPSGLARDAQGVLKVERTDSKHAKACLRQLKKQDPLAAVIELEDAQHEWLVKLLDERNVATILDPYSRVADDIIEAVKDLVKDPAEEPKPVAKA